MAERKRATQENKADVERKHRAGQKESHTSFDTFQSRDEGLTPLNETPFNPRMGEHTATISRIPFSTQRHEFIMRLNNAYGYGYVQRLMKSMNTQAKLAVSDPNDVYEQEADRVAEKVTRTINTPVQKQAPEEEEELQMQTTVKDVGRKNHFVYRQSEEEELLQSKTNVRRQIPEEEEELQTQPDESTVTTVAGDIETRINSTRGSGHPLSDDVRKPMEQAFGADFSSVRVHTDSEADTLNRQLSAKAFTTGQDVFFRQDEYNPGSDSGRKLIAHELTHVVQQGNDVRRKLSGRAYRNVTQNIDPAANSLNGDFSLGYTPPVLNDQRVDVKGAAENNINGPEIEVTEADGGFQAKVTKDPDNVATSDQDLMTDPPWRAQGSGLQLYIACGGPTELDYLNNWKSGTLEIVGEGGKPKNLAEQVKKHEDVHAADNLQSAADNLLPWHTKLENMKKNETTFQAGSADQAEEQLYQAAGGKPEEIANKYISACEKKSDEFHDKTEGKTSVHDPKVSKWRKRVKLEITQP